MEGGTKMKYSDIIKNNSENHSAVSWWPKFAFHYTDVTNAVSILSSGTLYSRTRAEALGLMSNDNASRQVIDMTQTEATANVRFYFRPLTPTQYYNEGFKHSDLRYDQDLNANVPVPVFLLFDLEKVLSMPDIKFSELPQSGHGSNLCSRVEEFADFNFDMIYSSGYSDNFEQAKRLRHAEILYPNSFKIDTSINAILCRNNIEKTTLLNLLKENDNKAYHKYKPIIKICREDMFQNNALFIKDCQYHAGTVSITFSDYYNKEKYMNKMMELNSIDSLKLITGRLELEWKNTRRICYRTEIECEINYETTSSIVFRNLPNILDARFIKICFYVEDSLMCCIEHPLEEFGTY